MMNLMRQLLTGVDGTTHDLGRWSWVGSFIAVIAATVANWVHGVAIDLGALSQALGVVAGAHGVAIFAKKDTEPKP